MNSYGNGTMKTIDDRLKQAYEILTKRNNNHLLNIKDIGTIIRAAGYSPTNNELKQHIELKLGRICPHQLLNFKMIQDICIGLKQHSEKDIHDSLRCFDYERNGFMLAKELKYFLSTYGEKLSEEEIDEMLRDMDIDEQGMLSIEQALSMFYANDCTK